MGGGCRHDREREHMTKGAGIVRSSFLWALLTGVPLGPIGLFALDGRLFVSAQSQSSDASLSYVDIGTFTSGKASHTASVTNRVRETTVTPTVSHSGASYAIELGDVEDSNGTASLSVGSNVSTVKVAAEDEITTQTYTVKGSLVMLPCQQRSHQPARSRPVRGDPYHVRPDGDFPVEPIQRDARPDLSIIAFQT